MVNVPATKDLIQESEGNLTIPEIRVWCHPHHIGESGGDYYNVFNSFMKALAFIKKHKEAERVPLIAVNGYELNIFEVK